MQPSEQLTPIQLTEPQYRLVTTDKQFPAMVAGFGAGKTDALINRGIYLKFKYPTCNIAYYMPTYDLIATTAFPRFGAKLATMGLREGDDFQLITAKTPMIRFTGAGAIIMRTMDNPGRIVAYEVADSLVDELDTLKEKDAALVWTKILGRNRQKKPDGAANTVAVGTTPEGFKFVYKRWFKEPPSADYEIIRAPTSSNARNLPAGYIQELTDAYPSALISAYLDGEFVNLTSGSIYAEFSRDTHGCDSAIEPGEALHIGMDFNVTRMAYVVFVPRRVGDDWQPHAVEEAFGLFDTPATIADIKRRFPGHPIFIYPDASGQARKSNNASVSDLSLLRAAGFKVVANSANPAVKDRITAMNILIHQVRLRVNIAACPSFTDALEKQVFDDKGEPDKKAGFDHIADAGGYFICYRYPVVGGRVQRVALRGV